MAALLHTGQCREWWCVCVCITGGGRREPPGLPTASWARIPVPSPLSLAVNPEKTVWPAFRNTGWVCHTFATLPYLLASHLPSTLQDQGLLPCCPCTATIGEEAGNAPSGVSLLHGPPSCTSFEKSSLLSSTVPHPDTRHGPFERRPRQVEPELFTCRHRSEGESRSS